MSRRGPGGKKERSVFPKREEEKVMLKSLKDAVPSVRSCRCSQGWTAVCSGRGDRRDQMGGRCAGGEPGHSQSIEPALGNCTKVGSRSWGGGGLILKIT